MAVKGYKRSHFFYLELFLKLVLDNKTLKGCNLSYKQGGIVSIM